MEHVLKDPDIFPDEKILKKHLGKNYNYYLRVIEYTKEHVADVQEVWNYYRDGKSWLLRLMKKSKTYFWIGIYSNAFKVTFYLNSSTEKKILTSDIPENLKEEYAKTKDRKIRWISFEVNSKESFDSFIKLLEINNKLK